MEINPNAASTAATLAFCEAAAGFGEEAKAHALLALRLSPRDAWISGNAQLALAMATYCGREYAEAVRWAEQAIQSHPRAPIRRAIMIGCCARAGDMKRAAQERCSTSLPRISSPVCFVAKTGSSLARRTWSTCSTYCQTNHSVLLFTRPEDMEHLLDGLRLGAGEAL